MGKVTDRGWYKDTDPVYAKGPSVLVPSSPLGFEQELTPPEGENRFSKKEMAQMLKLMEIAGRLNGW